MHKRLYTFFRHAVGLVSAAFALIIFVFNVYYHTTVSYSELEIATISNHLLASFLMLILIAFLVFGISIFSKQLTRINQHWLFIVLSLLYCFGAAYLILNSNDVLRADASTVHWAALGVKNGDYSSFASGGYIHTYPHQLGLMVFDLLLSYISDSAVVNFVANAILVLGINYISWLLSKKMFHDTLIHLLTMILSFLFFPQLLFVKFAYGQIPGLFFLLLGFLFALQFCETLHWRNCLGLLICLSLSLLLRKNNLIGAIAILSYLFLQTLKALDWKKMIAILLTAACMIVPNWLIVTIFEHQTGADLQNGCPSILWIAMGTDIDNTRRGPGWNDASCYSTYMSTDSQAEAASALGVEKIKQNWEKIINDPVRAINFFRLKVASTWCDPLYQSIWSGPIEGTGQETYTPLLNELYSGGKIEDVAEAGAKLVSLLILFGVCIFFIAGGKRENGWEISLLYFVGGILFHLMWETKSQYVYPYVFCLIPVSAWGIHRLVVLARTVIDRIQK